MASHFEKLNVVHGNKFIVGKEVTQSGSEVLVREETASSRTRIVCDAALFGQRDLFFSAAALNSWKFRSVNPAIRLRFRGWEALG